MIQPKQRMQRDSDPKTLKSLMIGCGPVALLIILACAGLIYEDSYIQQRETFRDILQTTDFGEVETALVARWDDRGDVVVLGSPYYLLVRFLTSRKDIKSVELVTLTLKSTDSAKRHEFGPVTDDLKPMGHEFYFGQRTISPTETHRYAAFMFEELAIGHEAYKMSGTIRVSTTDADYEVPIQGVLVPETKSERRSRIWEGAMSA